MYKCIFRQTKGILHNTTRYIHTYVHEFNQHQLHTIPSNTLNLHKIHPVLDARIYRNECLQRRITQIYGFLLHLGQIEYFNTGSMKQSPSRDIKGRINGIYTRLYTRPLEFGNLIADSNHVRGLVHLHELAFETAYAV